MVDKLYYNTTLSQTFSPCGNYLVAGNIYGELAVFDIANILNPPDGATQPMKAFTHFMAPRDEQICSLAKTDNFLIVGTVGEITGWDWSTIGQNKHPKLSWTIQIPVTRDSFEKPDVNAMAVAENEATGMTMLYAGCGDKKIHVFNLEDGKHVRSMEGHDDYIHSIDQQGNQLVSAGEDGAVRLWDLRQKSLTAVVTPHTQPKVERPSLGKWIGDAALSDDWLVCGGGPRLSLWHLRTMDVMASFNSVEDSGLHVTRFHEDKIIAGGTAPNLYHLSLTGDVSSQIQVSSTTVFSVCIQDSPHHVMCIAGSSPNIDLCTNFAYRDQVLSFA
ncbi:THO complex subunit 6 homolog [Macrosteles quadrilineatus]|uniref:THO complex subunit 6 homolog n=1 Tax=Macrosteles quadrilineatus TaxID=74068 RepID=UPI0023E09E0A|nr:THO complex subunit 6 homolog [Macrosteles quadrilineatus]XP_054258777.1 THO complex subunit 6 homolog [Macrosteles quadrilineatus]